MKSSSSELLAEAALAVLAYGSVDLDDVTTWISSSPAVLASPFFLLFLSPPTSLLLGIALFDISAPFLQLPTLPQY